MSAVLFLLLRCLSLLGVWFAANGVAPSIQDLSYCYYHSDHLGSSSLMTDQNGTLVRQQYGYRAFGSERFSLNILPSFTSRFTGQPYDAETGLYYFQSRYYDPELGRFIQPDTIVPDPGSSQSLNRYSYVLNNPLKYIDPTGHVPQPANWNQTAFWNPDLSGRAYFDQSSYWNTSFNPGPSRQWFKTTSDDVGWLGAGYGRDWLGLGYQAGGYRTSELPSNNPDPYAHWDYSRTPTVGETVKAVASVALLAVPGGAPVRIIGATMRVARAAAAARVGATFVAPRAIPLAARTAIHKNSLKYIGETHVYRIKGPDGTTFKIGESARGVRQSDGLSIRAEQQVRQLIREKGPGFESEIRKTFGSKAEARDYERRLIERFRRRYGEDTLPGNKSDH